MQRLCIPVRLALETLLLPSDPFDPERVIPPSIIPPDSPLYINLLSLTRAVSSHNKDILTVKELVPLVLQELEFIYEVFELHNRIKPKVYFINYGKYVVRKKLKDKIREFKKGSKVEVQTNLISKATGEVRKSIEDMIFLPNENVPSKAFLFSHILMDMLIANIGYPILLEAHTGTARPITSMYNRLANVGKIKIPPIPFNWKTLYLFGDKVILPEDIKLRREAIALLTESNIKATSSNSLLTTVLNKLKDSPLVRSLDIKPKETMMRTINTLLKL